MAEKPNPSDHFLAYMFPCFAFCHFSVCRSCKTLIQVLIFRLIRLSVTCWLRDKNQRLWARAETQHNLRNTLFVAILTIFPPQKIFLHFLFVGILIFLLWEVDREKKCLQKIGSPIFTMVDAFKIIFDNFRRFAQLLLWTRPSHETTTSSTDSQSPAHIQAISLPRSLCLRHTERLIR